MKAMMTYAKSMANSLQHGPKYKSDTPIDIKACFFDIDNTLVSNDSAELPSERFLQLVHELRDHVLIGVATARSLQRAEHILSAIDAKGISILSNGAVLYDAANKKILVDNSLPLDIANHLIQELRRHHFSYEIQDDGIDYTWAYSDDNDPTTYTSAIDPLYPKGARREVSDYVPQKPRILCATVFSQQDVRRVHTLVREHGDKSVTSFIGHTTTLAEGKTRYEIFVVHKNANKKWAISEALEILDIPPENVMAAVDGHNDLVLLEMAGVGVAVANAVPEVLANATFIAPSQKEDGAAIALDELVNQRIKKET